MPTSGPLPIADPFDIFCVCGDASPYIIDYDEVTSTGSWLQDVVAGELRGSSAGASTSLYVAKSIPASWTLEAQFHPIKLPPNNTDTQNRRVALSVVDPAGYAVTLMFSNGGISYGAHYDGPVSMLPGSAGMVQENRHYLVRIVSEANQGVIYVYITEVGANLVGGQQLRFVLPAIEASTLPAVPAEGVYLSLQGTAAASVVVGVEGLCLATGFLPANRQPVAVTGFDRYVRSCEVLLLDGTGSYDPEGQPLSYQWRLTDAPADSTYVVQYLNGETFPLAVPTGYTDKLYSASFTAEAPAVGDVVRIGEDAYTVIDAGLDGDGRYVQFALQFLADSLTDLAFRVLAQSVLTDADSSKATCIPDVPGFFKFDLQVFDGGLYSDLDTLVISAVEGVIPRGCTPDAGFLWDYLSDFWSMVEGKERIDTLWSSTIQILSSQMHTLWQTEYGKSLRDIPRKVLRRWMHYDLALREPYSELTKIRTPWAPIEGNNLAQKASYPGQKLVLSVPYFDDLITLDIPSGEQTPKQLATFLEESLQEYDDRFHVVLLVDATPTQSRLYLHAPFRVTVVAGTTFSGFSVGVDTEPLQGESGAVVTGPSTLQVDRTLFGVPLDDGDGVYIETTEGTYVRTVASIVDVPGDTYRYQRINVVGDLPNEQIVLWGLTATLKSTQLDFYKGLVVHADKLVIERVDVQEGTLDHVVVDALGCTEDKPNFIHFSVDALFEQHLARDKRFLLLLWGLFRRHYMPIEEVIAEIPSMQVRVKDPESDEVLQQNADYFLEEYRGSRCIRFASGLFSPELFTPVPRLWAEHTYLDNSDAIEAQFGLPVEFTRDDSAAIGATDYLSAVRGLWFAYTQGPTMRALRVGVQILLGLPFAEVDGTITEIRTDFSVKSGRILIQDTARPEVTRSYSFRNGLALETNPRTKAAYKVGDTVRAFDPLVTGVAVLDWVSDPEAFDSLLSQGLFNHLQKFHTFMVRAESSIFTLPALTFILAFLRRIKPTYTNPLFVVRSDQEDVEIELLEEFDMSVQIEINDGVPWRLPFTKPPGLLGSAAQTWLAVNTNPLNHVGMTDDPSLNPDVAKGGSGHFEGVSDTDYDPANALPTYPTSDFGSLQADSHFLSPEMFISMLASTTLAAPDLPVESVVFPANRPTWSERPLLFGQQHLRNVLADGNLLLETEVLDAPLTVNGIRLQIRGVPPSVSDTVTISVLVNGTEVFTDNYTHNTEHFEIFWTDLGGIYVPPECRVMTPFNLSATDEVHVLLYAASGSTKVYYNAIQLTMGTVVAWDALTPLAAGTYYNTQAV